MKYQAYEDHNTVVSVVDGPYADEFDIVVDAQSGVATVRRIDAKCGWGQDLKLIVHEKHTGRMKTVRVGPSEENEASASVAFNMHIPRHIYICYKTKDVPESVMRDLSSLNPAHQISLFDDDDCREFLGDNFGGEAADCFSWIPRGEIKADFWRACVLLRNGGVYFDIDVRHILGADDYLDPSATFLTSTSETGNHMNPIVIMSKSGNSVLELCAWSFMERFRRKMRFGYWDWSICGAMFKAVKKVLGVEVGNGFGAMITQGDEVYQFLNECKGGPRSDIFTHWRGVKVLYNHHWSYVERPKHKGFKPEQKPAENDEFRVEIMDHMFIDMFEIEFDGDSVGIRRVDENSGWGLDMMLSVTHKATGRNRTIAVGPSDGNKKVIRMPAQRPVDSDKYRVEVVDHGLQDLFDLKIEGDLVSITRFDMDQGWGQNLILKATNRSTGREKLIEVGPSDANNKMVDISL